MLAKAIQTTYTRSGVLASLPVRHFAKGTKMAKFDFQDPFVFNDLLTEDERMIRDSAREFA